MANTSSNTQSSKQPKRQRPANAEEEHANLNESDEEMFAQLDGTVFKRFFYYASPYKKEMLIATLAVVGFTLANLAVPLLVKLGIDNAIGKGDSNLLGIIAISMVVVAAVYWFTNYLQSVLITRVALTVLYDIRADMFLQLQRLASNLARRRRVLRDKSPGSAAPKRGRPTCGAATGLPRVDVPAQPCISGLRGVPSWLQSQATTFPVRRRAAQAPPPPPSLLTTIALLVVSRQHSYLCASASASQSARISGSLAGKRAMKERIKPARVAGNSVSLATVGPCSPFFKVLV